MRPAVCEFVVLGHLHLHGAIPTMGAAGLLAHVGEQPCGGLARNGSR